MSPRGHCDHSCHFKELCIQEESDRGNGGNITRLRRESENKKSPTRLQICRKLKGMWKKVLLNPLIYKAVSKKHFLSVTQGGTHLQGCSCIQANATLRSTAVCFSVCLLLFFSEQWKWRWDASLSGCTWRVACPPSNHPGEVNQNGINCTF